MSEPFVCCITPSHLSEFYERAKAVFESQTYPNKAWFPLDTRGMKLTVGALRNLMLRDTEHMIAGALIAHLDHDDWSAPTRLAEQVAFMQETNAPVVGYCDMPFYDAIHDRVLFFDSRNPHYALGTSLMYRREVWERIPFPDATPEDTTWQHQLGASNIRSISSLRAGRPMMVQTIHKGNACPKSGARFAPASPELDAAVRALLSISNVAH